MLTKLAIRERLRPEGNGNCSGGLAAPDQGPCSWITERQSGISLSAFTLMEVMVVVGIITILVAVLIPVIHKAREQARTAMCATNLRTSAMGVYYYAQAFNDYYPESGKWAESSRIYIQKLSAGKLNAQDTRGLESGGVDQVVEFYKCPSDPIKVPTSEMQQYVNGKLVWTNYLVSYAFNGFLSFPLRYPDKAREGADFSLDVPGTNYVRLQKTTSIRRPTEIVMLTDAGDDDVGFKGSLMWDFDDEIDNFKAAEAPRLEVHHKIGNNFLYADVHVEFKKILRRTGAQEKSGVPAFPWHWVPIEGFARLAP